MGRLVARRTGWWMSRIIAVGLVIPFLYQMVPFSPADDKYLEDSDEVIEYADGTTSAKQERRELTGHLWDVTDEIMDVGQKNQDPGEIQSVNITDNDRPTLEAAVMFDVNGDRDGGMPLSWRIQWLEYMKYAGVDHIHVYSNVKNATINMWEDGSQLGSYIGSSFLSVTKLGEDYDVSLWQRQIVVRYLEGNNRPNLWLLLCRMDQYPVVLEDTRRGFLKIFVFGSTTKLITVKNTLCIGEHSAVPPILLIDNQQCQSLVFEGRDSILLVQPAGCKAERTNYGRCDGKTVVKKSFFVDRGTTLQVFDYSKLKKVFQQPKTMQSIGTELTQCCQPLAAALRPLVLLALESTTVNIVLKDVEKIDTNLAGIRTSVKYLTRFRDELFPSNLSAMLLPYGDGPRAGSLNTRWGAQKDANAPKYYLSTLLLNRVFLDDLFKITLWELWQFLEYQRYMGVEHIYWYDTAHSPDEFMEDGLKPYIDAGYITYHRFHEIIGSETNIHYEQDKSYEHFFQTYQHETKWVTVCDVDEYFFMPNDTAPNFLIRLLREEFDAQASSESLGAVTQIVVPCMTFLGAPQQDLPALMIERYQRRSPRHEVKQRRAKLIVLASAWMRLMRRNPHSMVMKRGAKFVSDATTLRFNHYWGGRLTNFEPETMEDVENLVFDDSMNPIARALWEKLSHSVTEMQRIKVDSQIKLLTRQADEIAEALHNIKNVPSRLHEP